MSAFAPSCAVANPSTEVQDVPSRENAPEPQEMKERVVPLLNDVELECSFIVPSNDTAEPIPPPLIYPGELRDPEIGETAPISPPMYPASSNVNDDDVLEISTPGVTEAMERRVPSLPDDVLGTTLDYFLQGPLLQSVEHLTRITDSESSYSLLKDLKAAKELLAGFRFVSKRFAKLAGVRLFQILVVWPTRRVGRRVNIAFIEQKVFGRPMSSYIKSICFRYAHVSSALGEVLVNIVKACHGLETFLLCTDTMDYGHVRQIMDLLVQHSDNTLVKFECFLSQALQHLPYLYSHSFPNLRVFTSTLSKTRLRIVRNILIPLPADSLFVTEKFNFEHLHSLRIGHPFVLTKQVSWLASKLSSLTVDFHPPFDAEDFLVPFLHTNGKQLISLDVRYIGPLRQRIYSLCPNVVDFVLDIEGNPVCDVPIKTVLHEKIIRIGLRGCALSFWETTDTSMDVFKFLVEFIKEGAYPSLKEVHLLDFDPKAFKHYTWTKQTAWLWLIFLRDYRDAGIKLLDTWGKPCEESDLVNLVDYAIEERIMGILLDGLLEDVDDDDSDISLEIEVEE